MSELMLILSNTQISEGIFEMQLHGKIMQTAKPGQYINICFNSKIMAKGSNMTISQVTPHALIVVYKVLDEDTKLLASVRCGIYIEVVGPFGDVFPTLINRTPLMVSTGVGIAPLIEVMKNVGNERMHVAVECDTIDDIFYYAVLNRISKLHVATKDGSFGYHGTVVDMIKEMDIKFDLYYACGSPSMLQDMSENFSNTEGYLLQRDGLVRRRKKDQVDGLYEEGKIYKSGELKTIVNANEN